MSGTWLDQLQPASWRGLPFAVRGSEYRRGRRVAVHEYPYRDRPWAEDMGLASRLVGFSGFVVGDDCYQQAQALLKAAEQPGSGELVHPSLGSMTVSLVEPMVGIERADLGRVVELRFEFIEGGEPLYPSDATSTQDKVADKADATDDAGGQAFSSSFRSDANASAAGDAQQAGSVSYTDVNGKQTTLPGPAGGANYQANIGGDVAGAWGDQAKAQAFDASLTAGGAAPVEPPPDTTFSRFDPQPAPDTTTIPSPSPADVGGATGTALDGQVEQRNEIDQNADAAARAAAIS